MNIEKIVTGNKAVLKLDGWLDTKTAPQLGEELDKLEEGVSELVFDLTALEYISSAGLRQIVAAHKKMSGNLTLEHVSPTIMDLLNMTGLGKKLNIQ